MVPGHSVTDVVRVQDDALPSLLGSIESLLDLGQHLLAVALAGAVDPLSKPLELRHELLGLLQNGLPVVHTA